MNMETDTEQAWDEEQESLEQRLDQALIDSFPASDPIAVFTGR